MISVWGMMAELISANIGEMNSEKLHVDEILSNICKILRFSAPESVSELPWQRQNCF